MVLKFSVSNNNGPKKVASTGAYGQSTGSGLNNKYAICSTATVPVTKNAQFAGSGANVTFTQPMFFSPLHTPQNWQIASKRREVYQWIYTPDNTVLTSDYTHKNIDSLAFTSSDIIKDSITGGLLYENIDSEKVVSSSGILRNPIRYAIRDCENKTFFSFSAYGYWRELKVSEEHPMIVLDGKSYRKKVKIANNENYRREKGIRNSGIRKVKINDSLILKKEAKDVKKEDFLITPVPTFSEQKDFDKDKAWMIGLCIADGTIRGKDNNYVVRFTQSSKESYLDVLFNYLEEGFDGKTRSHIHGDGDGWRITKDVKQAYDFFAKYIIGKFTQKKFTKEVFSLNKEAKLNLLGGYFDGDGHFNPVEEKLIANNYSCDMADQIYSLLLSCGIVCSLKRYPLYGDHYETKSEWCYRITLPSSEVLKLKPYMRSNKIPVSFKGKKSRELRFFYKENGVEYLAEPISCIRKFQYSGKGFDLQIDPERAFVASGFACSNCRFYYDNEPKVAAGIDFYSQFPMNGFKLECKSKKILKYYENVIKNLKLNYLLKLISHEYFKLGDVFLFTEVECPHCGGSGFKRNGEACNHADGTIKKLLVLNPDWIEVKKSVLAGDPVIVLLPDEELKNIVSSKTPKQIYESLPKKLIDLVMSGQPIHLSNRSVSHLKHNETPYADYGVSLIRRLFTILAYKTKLMTANWIVAERMILPIRVVKIGTEARPAGPDDIADVSAQLSAVANDPNLTLITHHAFEYDWYGASGKIHNITQELEYVGKEILDGLMLNQSLLNGEMASYSSAQVGVETLLRRLDSWRATLAEWVENHIFLPIAMMRGFIDEKESKEIGETVYLYPKIKWNDLNLRDNSNHLQAIMQLHDKSLISTQKLLEEFDIDYDQEVERMREEQIMAGPAGPGSGLGGLGGMGGLGGGMPPMGGGGGGMPPLDLGGGGSGLGDAGSGLGAGGPLGDVAGAGGGMEAPMGGGAADASAMIPPNLKITKKGRGHKNLKEQIQAPPPTFIKLTKLEQKMYKIIEGLDAPYRPYGQYKVHIKGNQQPFLIDFAFPQIGVAIEADGKAWHETVEAIQRDKNRDQILANVGWRILRFREDAIQEKPEEVAKVIQMHINDAVKNKKKAEHEDGFIKEASFNNLEDKEIIGKIELDNDLGYMIIFGNK